jgi:hypothetical protein
LVIANKPAGSGIAHTLGLNFDRQTPGTSPIPTSVCTASVCPSLVFNWEYDYGADSQTHHCWLTSGSLTLDSVTGGRVTGTFAGAGFCSNGTGANTPFSIVDGSFDVDLRPAPFTQA